MASPQSSRGRRLLCKDHQPSAIGRRPSRWSYSEKRIAEQPHQRPGMLQEGNLVHVFSRSADAWVDAEVSKLMDGNHVRVEYEVGEWWCGKTLHVHSDYLKIPSAITSSSEEEHDPGCPGGLRRTVAEDLAGKGFTVRQLLKFCDEKVDPKNMDGEMTTNEVVKTIIIPETAEHRTCYMESEFMKEEGGPQQAHKLVSHAWNSRFWITVLNIVVDASGLDKQEIQNFSSGFSAKKLLYELEDDVLQKTYWLCIFAVNEHVSICGTCWNCKPEKPEELAADRCKCSESCTCKHRDQCGHCWTEWGKGKKKFNPCACGTRKLQKGEPGYEIDQFDAVVELMHYGLLVSLDPKLETLERIWVVAEVCKAIEARKSVQFKSAGGLDESAMRKLRSSEPLVPEVKDCKYTDKKDYDMIIAKITDQDAFNNFVWTMVEMSFGDIRRLGGVTGTALSTLNRLQYLAVDFSWKKDMKCVSELGWGGCLEELWGLQTLKMDFSGCEQLQDVNPISESLPKLRELQHVTMNFNQCSGFMDNGVRSLIQGVAQLLKLQQLTMTFCKCNQLTDMSPVRLEGFNALEYLDLSIINCQRLTHAIRFGRGFRKLKELWLNFRGCNELNDLADVVPQCNQSIAMTLNLRCCRHGLNMDSMDQIGKCLPFKSAMARKADGYAVLYLETCYELPELLQRKYGAVEKFRDDLKASKKI